MRLIDAEAFLKAEIDRCGSAPFVGTCTSDNEYLSERLKKAPTIEVKPIVHAHWEIVVGSNGKEYMVCTGCRKQQDLTGVFSYCPNCGAMMDEKENNK